MVRALRGGTPHFSYQGETKDLQAESLYEGETKELGDFSDLTDEWGRANGQREIVPRA